MTQKKVLLLCVWFIAIATTILLIISTLSSLQHTSSIEVDYAPLRSTFLLDGKKQKPGIIKVTPGKHTYVVRFDGFLDQKGTVDTHKGSSVYIGVSLSPSTPKTADWYENHPEDAHIAERISGRNTDITADRALELEPFIKELPFIGPGFAYEVGAGSIDKDGRPIIIIRAPTEEGVEDALNWIRSLGYKPDRMNIQINPNYDSRDEAI